jgi:hypothetical protein
MVLGLMKQVHVRRAVLTEDGEKVDPAKLRPVARLGGGLYTRLGDSFDLARPSWKVYKDKLKDVKQA